jgi:hypothetical protein
VELEKEEEAIIVPMAAAERSVRGFWRIYARLCLRTVRITHVDRWTYRARRKVVPPRKRVDRFTARPTRTVSKNCCQWALPARERE